MSSKLQILGAVLLLAAPAFADAGDPPSRVARLNYESGSVSFRPGSVDDWSPATPNYPLTTGDHLWADQGARAEMHIGSTAIRLDSETALSFLNLDDRTVQLSLTAGVIQIHLRALADDQIFEVDTPNVSISLLRPGDYRIQSDGDNAVTAISVRGGEAELTGGGQAFPVHPREAARVTGTDSTTNELVEVLPPDEFERWSLDRDRREEQVQSVRYVPREMIGYEDLDGHGVWREEPQYGWVWTPSDVVVGWAPYRYGRWVWVAPWGWTWVDDAPWGFAPFHYGRWAFAAGAWVWVPGRVVARPVYAPALVAFVGGPRLSVSVAVGGGGGVAWFPLGPGEVYRPAYHVSPTYVQNVNITHVNVTNVNVTNVNVTNVRYVNQNVQGAVTAVPQQAFVSARPVGQVARVMPAREAGQAQVMGTTAAIAPRPESVVAPRAGAAAVARPPAQVMQHTVVARTPPPPAPVPFRAQQQALQTNQGRPLDPATLNTLRPAQPAPQVRTVQQAPVSRPQPSFGGPRNERPANATPPPVFQPSRPVTPNAQPAQAPRPVPEDRPIRNDRPANATPAPVQPRPVTPNAQPAPRPVPEDRPIRNDRPANAAPAPVQPRPVTPNAPPDRPIRNDRPANAAPPARGPAPERNVEERKAPARQARPDRREDRKE